MLKLKNLVKNYELGDVTVHALKGLDIEFREKEFVSILGPSGCGKTTLLNVLGGLDHYTSGDLIINGRSTKGYNDHDWDIYRNKSIGFVFQGYNLISHQTVLSNVELALTLSGVSKEERRRRAIEALESVGLGDQLNKKPGQMSGGQQQRVAIARALINDPEIILADEPTGALDSETSEQIMDLLKSVADDKLVIMVTHNAELAEEYSSRIIRLMDGQVVSDSAPYKGEEKAEDKGRKKTKRNKALSLKPGTAVSLSVNNLLTKKARTALTAIAGSIGIIGIALIMSLSSGMQAYIDRMQEDTLSSYPITIEQTSADMSSLMTSFMDTMTGDGDHDLDKVYTNKIMGSVFESFMSETTDNNVAGFKEYMEDHMDDLEDSITGISYTYALNMDIYKGDDEDAEKVYPIEVMESMMSMGDDTDVGMASTMGTAMEVWTELLDNQEVLDNQYEVLAGQWPENYDEVVIVVDENNEISDYAMYGLGLKDAEELEDMLKAATDGEEITTEAVDYTYDEILDLTYTVVLCADYYEKDGDIWVDRSEDDEFMKDVIEDSLKVKVTGIVRPAEDSVMAGMGGAVGYTKEFTNYLVAETGEREIVKEQLEQEDIDVFTGLEFEDEDEESEDEEEVPAEIDYSQFTEEELAYIETLTEEELAEMMEMMTESTDATYEGNLKILGIVDEDDPSTINIYPADFDAKEEIEDFIAQYNDSVREDEDDPDAIVYTDIMGTMMGSMSTIINIISYVLMAFVSISLIVSSIMIGIITYVSVLERTKEIGILKSIGASSRDITLVFNAETLIEGFASGALGIGITLLLNIPINMVIKSLTDIDGIAALPLAGGIGLIILSMCLTFIAGLIPARIAAKKDPVEAIRSE